MAVYTELRREDLLAVCRAYGLGEPLRLDPIPAGSINTNYRLHVARGRVFLRLTTARDAEALRFEAGLLRHLRAHDFPGPTLLETPGGRTFLELEAGRVSLFGWLEGEELDREGFNADHARALGEALGRMHRLTANGALDLPPRENPYGPDVVAGWLEGLGREEDEEVRACLPELREALAVSRTYRELAGPRGVIHADLFMDNVKWPAPSAPVFFDFEMACHEALALDLAITLEAWCFSGGAFRPDLCRALMEGYGSQRPLAEGEAQTLWHAALFGAVRYTASRIRDFHLSPLGADRLVPKDFRTWLSRVRTVRALGPSGFSALWGGT